MESRTRKLLNQEWRKKGKSSSRRVRKFTRRCNVWGAHAPRVLAMAPSPSRTLKSYSMPAPKPTIYLIAGCNGAGKTTFAKEFLPSIGVVRFLNADEIARGLSPLRPEAVAFKAGKLLLSELRELIDRQETFALESTLSGRTY